MMMTCIHFTKTLTIWTLCKLTKIRLGKTVIIRLLLRNIFGIIVVTPVQVSALAYPTGTHLVVIDPSLG